MNFLHREKMVVINLGGRLVVRREKKAKRLENREEEGLKVEALKVEGAQRRGRRRRKEEGLKVEALEVEGA